jgi:hypothetical protein
MSAAAGNRIQSSIPLPVAILIESSLIIRIYGVKPHVDINQHETQLNQKETLLSVEPKSILLLFFCINVTLLYNASLYGMIQS